MKSMWEMKFLPQAMDTPLTVMMVPPWARTPTAQLSWAGQYAAHMHAPYGRRHQQRVWTHLPWRRDLRWRRAHCLLGQQRKFKGLERFRSIKNKGHFCPWNTLDFTWDVCYSNRLRRSRTIPAYSMQCNTETMKPKRPFSRDWLDFGKSHFFSDLQAKWCAGQVQETRDFLFS